jgi:hypothetical protein
MATTLGFKRVIDLPQWRPNSPALAATAAGSSLAYDYRNDDTNPPYLYLLRSATAFDIYDPTTDEWLALASPALAGTFGAGATAICHPTQGPRGTLTTGNTTSKIVLSTALPAAVAINQLANRGDGTGHRIAIIGNAAGSSGKVEFRKIIANTAGTTPTIWLDTPLSFTPASGDAYEIRAGRVFLLSAGTLAAGVWKYFDIATTSYSGNLTTTNLPATIGGDSSAVALSEAYVPNNRKPGEGFVNGAGTYDATTYNCIVATASGATTITGAGMPTDLAADEYRNFQIRIVEDTGAPTAAGQRRRISTHTGGAAGVFTVAAWAVTPSATAKFVVECDDDKILLFTNQTAVYNYNVTANTWDTTTWAAAANAGGAGIVAELAFGITRDTTNNARHSHIYRIRGGNVATIDVFDIAGAATGSWSADIAYKNKGGTLFNTGTSGAYDPATLEGRFVHLCVNGTQRMARFDLRNRTLDPETYLRFPPGAALVGAKMAWTPFIDGSTKLGFVYTLLSTSANMFSMAVQP